MYVDVGEGEQGRSYEDEVGHVVKQKERGIFKYKTDIYT